VQGAVDFIPDHSPRHTTVFIKNGTYEEIVYFRNKANITFLGEDRDKVVVCYANNEVFNPHPANITTNEVPGTFPSRRAVFMADNSSGIHLVNFTVRSINDQPAQAEGLLIMGEHNIVSHVTIEGSGDALQANGSVYLADSRIEGWGDNVLGRGPAFFRRCELVSSYGPHMWIRNTSAHHGNVFVDSTFRTVGSVETVIARSPTNHGKDYPYAEAVLIDCALDGVRPEGWGPIGGDVTHAHYWEYNSTNLGDGKPADVSRRHPASRQLSKEKDAETIARYRDPAFVLGGWMPAMAPLLLSQPAAATTEAGQAVSLSATIAAVPDATYQWFKNGEPVPGATSATLRLVSVRPEDAGAYSITAVNEHGRAESAAARVTVR
jgi:pectinesterase